ncbi:MAG: MBL fold metallo-hydrolase [Halioglobus sp.]|nr:MBL fold metallo-hydrolase [Halioglobus sp.]
MAYTSLANGITCIDAAYVREGMACFYLMEEGGECAVLETGTSHSADVLWQVLHERGIAREQVRYVIPTHVHLDHAGGAGAMMAALPHAQLLVHPRGARHMADPEKLVSAARAVYGEELFHTLYGEVKPVEVTRIREMADGESVTLAGRPLEFRHTRGHAEHHLCVWDEVSRGWFSGDMFGVSYPWCRFPAADFLLPSTTPSQFDPGAFIASLDLLGSYAPRRMYLTHYGELAYSAASSQLLVRQIEAYCELATTGSPGADLLQQQLSEYTLALLQGFATDGKENELRQQISFDMQLNAQGLQIWRQREASK